MCSACPKRAKIVSRMCRSCGRNKPLDEFHFADRARGYRRYKCNACTKTYNAQHYKENGRDRDARWRNHLRRKYNITPEQYDFLFTQQEGRCKICDELSDIRLAVDHDHETGKIRSLLCTRCNNWIGILEQSQFIFRALTYLRNHSSRSVTAIRKALRQSK